MRHFILPLLLLSLSACGTTRMPLTYAPQIAQPARAEAGPLVAVGEVAVNRRAGREDPYWIGTIRGGYGNPLKALEADAPVDQVVARAFQRGLAARGLLAPRSEAPPYRLHIAVQQLDANQYVRREATAEFVVTLFNTATGATAWTDRVRVYRVEGSVLSLQTGVFASVEDLHALMARVLGEAVDRTLDHPGFRTALR